jgi:predicted ester cyclase
MNKLEPLAGFGERYTAAWCSKNPASVAEFYHPNGWLRVNEADPAVGRTAISAVAAEFMTAFPDMQLLMDDIVLKGDYVLYHWTFLGTHTGPGGGGHRVHFSGFEEWKFSEDGLIAESKGHFDEDIYRRQLKEGFKETGG